MLVCRSWEGLRTFDILFGVRMKCLDSEKAYAFPEIYVSDPPLFTTKSSRYLGLKPSVGV